MKLRILILGIGFAVTPLVVYGGLSDYYKLLRGTKGTAKEGPGAGGVGVLIADKPVQTGHTVLSAIADNISNLTGKKYSLEDAKRKEQDEINAAIGDPSSPGIQVEAFEFDVDPLNLVTRKMYLQDLQASAATQGNQNAIKYFEALQAHETRMALFAQRLNALIKANNGKLDWSQRIRLSSELGLLDSQFTLADQEMREVRNRTIIQQSHRRMKDAVDERNNAQLEAVQKAILAVE